MAATATPWYKRRVPRSAHLASIPLSRLWMLLLAAFLLFSIFGFYTDLLNHGTLPYAVAFLVATISGFNAILWILAVSRLPVVFLPVLVALQFLIGPASNKGANWMMRIFHLHEVPAEQGIHFSASCIL